MLKLIVLALFIGGLGLGTNANAQCNTTMNPVFKTTSASGGTGSIRIVKYLTATGTMGMYNCYGVPSMHNAYACFPDSTASGLVPYLSAIAYPSMTTQPQCHFVCSCGGVTSVVVINSVNGLPVELMEFSVDSGSDSNSP